MLKKIVLVMNFEVDEIYEIRNMINSRLAEEFVTYCIEDSFVREKVLANIVSNGYDKTLINAFKAMDLETVFNAVSHSDMEKIFYKVNDIIFLKFEGNTYHEHDLDGVVVLPVIYSGSRPFTDHTYIGWVTPYDISHLIEHEKISKSAAEKAQNEYVTMLRNHCDEFDVFFDGNSIGDIVEYIRSL